MKNISVHCFLKFTASDLYH